ncbi:Rhamnogalacturonase B [Diplocarpon rosae]|nr:Rhamnogalacturonase B [Diplocarpon rosae]
MKLSLSWLPAIISLAGVHAVTLTDGTDTYTVNADSSDALEFVVSKDSCDITSIKYRGTQVQYSEENSHISSGLGTATVEADEITSDATDYVKITCTTDTLTHYLVVKDGESAIHMATHITEEPSIGELRFIARLNETILPNDDVDQASDIGDSTSTLEGEDVFIVDDQTRSKFYSSQRFIDDQVHSADTDLSFMGDLDLDGWVAASGRGTVQGTAAGVDGSAFQIVLHWFSVHAQYWVYADADGAFVSPAMREGTYTQVLYQGELKVATKNSVEVTAGAQTTADIESTWATGSTTLFQIGDWDGRPTGFRNADKQLRMHPSDSRMDSWGPLTYTVGTTDLDGFPMAAVQGVNDPVTIQFTLTDAEAGGAATLRVGTTLAYASGRPAVAINDEDAAVPDAPTKIDSRGFTRGAYRGFGEIYDFDIADGGLVAGENTITIAVSSGSSGDDFLAPNFARDISGIRFAIPTRLPSLRGA